MGCVNAKQAVPEKQRPETLQTQLVRHQDTERYDSLYKEGELLGKGITGTVHVVEHVKTGKKYAMKTINLDRVDNAQLKELRTEIEILRQLDHPNVVRLHEVYEDKGKNTIKLVMELLAGGDLAARMSEGRLSKESDVRRVVHQIVSACRYFHGRGVVHRDLKLENVMFSNSSNTSDIKVIDFGLGAQFFSEEMLEQTERIRDGRLRSRSVDDASLAGDDDDDDDDRKSQASSHASSQPTSPRRVLGPSSLGTPRKRSSGSDSGRRRRSHGTRVRLSSGATPSKKQVFKSRLFQTTCGTAYYMAPEMMSDRHNDVTEQKNGKGARGYLGDKVDIWAIGVITFILIAGRPPYTGKTDKAVFQKVQSCVPNYDTEAWEKVSPHCLRFVQGCLVHKPSLRFSAEAALKSKWLCPSSDPSPRHVGSTLDFEKSVIQAMCRFADYPILKKAGLMVIAHKHSDFQNQGFNHCFLKIDQNNQGFITLEELRSFMREREPALTNDEIKRVFLAVDQDRTEVIRYLEFLAASLEHNGPVSRNLALSAFDHLDYNRDGVLTRKSMHKILGWGYSRDEVVLSDAEGSIGDKQSVSRREFLRIMTGESDDDLDDLDDAATVNSDCTMLEEEELEDGGGELSSLLHRVPSTASAGSVSTLSSLGSFTGSRSTSVESRQSTSTLDTAPVRTSSKPALSLDIEALSEAPAGPRSDEVKPTPLGASSRDESPSPTSPSSQTSYFSVGGSEPAQHGRGDSGEGKGSGDDNTAESPEEPHAAGLGAVKETRIVAEAAAPEVTSGRGRTPPGPPPHAQAGQ